MYSLLVLLITLTLGGALAWHRSGKRADGLLFAMALTAALYTHYYTAFVWVGVMAAYSGYLLYREQMGRFMAWVGWNVGPLLAFAAWIPIALRQQASNGPQHWLSLQPRPRLLDVPAFVANCFGIHLGRYTMRLGWGIEPSLLAWGVLTIALLWMVLVTGNRVDSEETAPEDGDRGRLALLVGASLVPILLAWGISQFRNLWADRGLQVIVPALAIVSAIWIASIPRRRWAVAAGAFLLASGAVVSWHVTPKLEPWRETARALRKEVRWGETVAVTAPWTHECLTYYGIRKSQVLPVGAALFDEKEREELRKRGNSTRRLWLVVNRADGTKIDAFLREACGHVRVSERRFGGVLLAAYHRRGPVAKPHPQAAVPVPGPATP
ncbi:MAG: hypothetical protein K0Q72_4307 [Armatimonadetes bacterium]|nr:hypothetical protein [Armatimonadota bacterium]